MATLVITVIGDDQPGLVDALSGVISDHGGSWERSSMARLGSKFAGIVEVMAPDGRVDELIDDLAPLETQGLLDITVERANDLADEPSPAAELSTVHLELRLVGQDRPGIVHEISHALAEHGVSIDGLRTATSSAPMSGEPLFEAEAQLHAPADLDHDHLAAALEALANELMVDLDLSSDAR